jgi:hypothetical protein
MTRLPGDTEPDARPAAKQATLWQVIRIVVSMLFMIGRKGDYTPDAPAIGPARLIIVAVIVAALVIAGLVLLATVVTR